MTRLIAWPTWLVWLAWLSLLFSFYFILFYYIISFLTQISWLLFGMRKGAAIFLEGESPEFWKMGDFIFRGTTHILFPCGDRLQEGKKWKKGGKEVGFSFSARRFFLGKSGTGSTHEGGEDQILEEGEKTKSRGGDIGKKGGFSDRTFSTHRENVGEEIHPGEGNWKREADFASLEKF